MEEYQHTTEEEYFYEIFNEISDEVLTDEHYERNVTLINEISNSFFEYNSKSGNLPASLARKVFESIFNCIGKHGYR